MELLSKEKEVVSSLASRLISLYDANGDGVVDREEYRTMVNDMSALREVQTERRKKGRRPRQPALPRRQLRKRPQPRKTQPRVPRSTRRMQLPR